LGSRNYNQYRAQRLRLPRELARRKPDFVGKSDIEGLDKALYAHTFWEPSGRYYSVLAAALFALIVSAVATVGQFVSIASALGMVFPMLLAYALDKVPPILSPPASPTALTRFLSRRALRVFWSSRLSQ
jgi:hypothetical protein